MKGPALFQGEIITKEQQYIYEIKKNRLLQNNWANFNQTWHNSSLGEGESSFFKWRALPFSKGKYIDEIAKIH